MKGEKQVIERLNEALFLELGAVNQYWVHYRLLEDWGYTKLAKKERAESIEEMQHADKLIARIIFLEGHPNLQTVAPLRIGQNVKEVLEADLAGEYDARTSYKKLARHVQMPATTCQHEALRGAADRRGRPYRLPRNAAQLLGTRSATGKVRPAERQAPPTRPNRTMSTCGAPETLFDAAATISFSPCPGDADAGLARRTGFQAWRRQRTDPRPPAAFVTAVAAWRDTARPCRR
jgi:bacterioferritin